MKWTNLREFEQDSDGLTCLLMGPLSPAEDGWRVTCRGAEAGFRIRILSLNSACHAVYGIISA